MRFLNATEYSKWIVMDGKQLEHLGFPGKFKPELIYLVRLKDLEYLPDENGEPRGFWSTNVAYEVMSIVTKKKPLTIKDRERLTELGVKDDLGNLAEG